MNGNRTDTAAPGPASDVRALDRLVGTWTVSGGDASGTVVYEWMEGGFFLVQRMDVQQGGQRVVGMEVIGHDHAPGAGPSEEIRSHFYDDRGNTNQFVYELDSDTLTIRSDGSVGGARLQATFSADGDTLSGRWSYPDGSGYDSAMTRGR